MAKTGPVPQPGILEINAYVPGESNVPGGVKPIKLSSNETPLGPSPKAIAAYKAEADELDRYPDGGATTLRKAIAKHYGLNADRIVVRLRLRRADQPARARLHRARAMRRSTPSTASSCTRSPRCRAAASR